VRVLVDGSHDLGVSSQGSGTVLLLSDSEVRGTTARADGTFGRALDVSASGGLLATRVLLDQNVEVAASASGEGLALGLVDVIVAGVSPSARGYGAGAVAFGVGSIAATRLEDDDSNGKAQGAVPAGSTTGATIEGAQFTVVDLFERGVGNSTVHFTAPGSTAQAGAPVAYGLHASTACQLDATRAVIDRGGYGVADFAGVLAVHQGVIANQTVAGGAVVGVDNATGGFALEYTTFEGNAVDDVLHNAMIPPGG
jgi:hypothetical protein